MAGGLAFGYLSLVFFLFMIGIWILRWALRINKIVVELELIRKALVVAHGLGEVRDFEDNIKAVTKSDLKEAKKAVEKDNLRYSQKDVDAGYERLQKKDDRK